MSAYTWQLVSFCTARAIGIGVGIWFRLAGNNSAFVAQFLKLPHDWSTPKEHIQKRHKWKKNTAQNERNYSYNKIKFWFIAVGIWFDKLNFS